MQAHPYAHIQEIIDGCYRFKHIHYKLVTSLEC